MSFYAHFIPIVKSVYPSKMKVHLEITYNTRIRLLDEEEIECQLKETNNNNIASYYCETEIKNSNLK